MSVHAKINRALCTLSVTTRAATTGAFGRGGHIIGAVPSGTAFTTLSYYDMENVVSLLDENGWTGSTGHQDSEVAGVFVQRNGDGRVLVVVEDVEGLNVGVVRSAAKVAVAEIDRAINGFSGDEREAAFPIMTDADIEGLFNEA